MPAREPQLTYEDLVRLVELIESTSHFSEFRLKVGEIEVSLRRSSLVPGAPQQPATRDPVQEAFVQEDKRTQSQFGDDLRLVKAPMVGTFYRASAPGADPYVTVGQQVEPDSTLCIIEVMKLMNSIQAGARGVVREILVENACAVEHDQVLMVIEPR